MKFKHSLILFFIASAVAAIPVFLWLNSDTNLQENGWITMLHAPLFGLTLTIAVATLAYGWRSFKADRHIKNNGFLFNSDGPYLLPATGILFLTFIALISLGYEQSVPESNGWLLNYTSVRWEWVACYGLVSLFWWLFCWLPGPSPTLGFIVSWGVPACLLCLGGLTNDYGYFNGYFNLHGLILAFVTFFINLFFFGLFALLSIPARRNVRQRDSSV